MMQKLMLIENDPTMISLVSTLLNMEGFSVVSFDSHLNFDEILTAVRKEKPALILLDVHLNHLDGFDLLRKIRQDIELKSSRVFMSSGMDYRIRCIREGADGFIPKPYTPDELIQRIRLALGT